MEGRRRPLRATGALARLGRFGVAAQEDLEEALVAHLEVLLSTRQGSSPASPEYGLEDITDAIHTYPIGAQRIGARIRSAIEAYEPRLAPGVAVELLADDPGAAGPLHLSYRVMARLAADRRRLVVLRARVAPSGEVAIEVE